MKVTHAVNEKGIVSCIFDAGDYKYVTTPRRVIKESKDGKYLDSYKNCVEEQEAIHLAIYGNPPKKIYDYLFRGFEGAFNGR